MSRLSQAPGASGPFRARCWQSNAGLARSCVLVLGGVVAACAPGGGGVRPSDGGARVFADADGDRISDVDEGAAEERDTDSDGMPDYRDGDSDNDGIIDREEAGDEDTATPPVDSDGDGAPDYVDRDADGNGIEDADEGLEDADDDGLLDCRDLDDDGDTVLDSEEIGDAAAPVDTDGDGLADYRDPDSDGDSIRDRDEGQEDTDGDGTVDRIDDDSDGDGLLDIDEAGDTNPTTPPVDTDGDTVPDFRDADSDDDGLSDGRETELGLSPIDSDSDGDGVTDLIEIAAGTDPLNMAESPRTRGDFVFVVPFEAPPIPTSDVLSFSTSLQFADVYFVFDTTASMRDEIEAMGSATSGVPAVIDELRCRSSMQPCTDDGMCAEGRVCGASGMCIENPAERGCIPDIFTGFGTFTELDTYQNRQSLQADPRRTAMQIPRGTSGGDEEAPIQVPYCVADGTQCANGPGCAGGADTCPGFREDAVRILVMITDADDQCSGSRCSRFDVDGAGAALRADGIRYVGLFGTDDDRGAGSPQSVMQGIANAARRNPGDPTYVFPARGGAVVARATNAIRELTNAANFEVRLVAANADPMRDALRFVDYVETTRGGEGCPAEFREEPIQSADSVPADEPLGRDDLRPDYFPGLRPGAPVCWEVVPTTNDFLEPTREPQVFVAELRVTADGSLVDSRDVYFLVPPLIPPPMGPR